MAAIVVGEEPISGDPTVSEWGNPAGASQLHRVILRILKNGIIVNEYNFCL